MVRRFIWLIISLSLGGCITTNTHQTTNDLNWPADGARILVIEPDVTLGFINASEFREAKADWTLSAQALLYAELEEQLKVKKKEVVPFKLKEASAPQLQLLKLHDVVSLVILQHKYENNDLPSKVDDFDWSLGPGVDVFRQSHQADYALILMVRGEYASIAKQIVNGASILSSAFTGITFMGSTGQQIILASLVDLKTGDIIWFNKAVTTAGTDMRKERGARDIVRRLLQTAPL
ncbi:MAG: hypothetical protein AAF603_09545 [Pseudomonadota bacterium]